jgi:hypothetical protein
MTFLEGIIYSTWVGVMLLLVENFVKEIIRR